MTKKPDDIPLYLLDKLFLFASTPPVDEEGGVFCWCLVDAVSPNTKGIEAKFFALEKSNLVEAQWVDDPWGDNIDRLAVRLTQEGFELAVERNVSAVVRKNQAEAEAKAQAVVLKTTYGVNPIYGQF